MSTNGERWTIRVTSEVRAWLRELNTAQPSTYRDVNAAIDLLAEIGPALGRPLVDTLHGSDVHNLKELRPRSGREMALRILFAFDPWSQAILLTAGNKAGNWSAWYTEAIPVAEKAYAAWLIAEAQRRKETDR
ncbi:type II toxin-antitoxin system RelE/ParE family toxin [Actinocatenispora sera]|uniref:DNA-binding protein n=1 Tax=Actinocatenispora sera TaxID=390989 RepID=A0A810LC71_9ACTN|nr:type II toxin-antitoxin system RelE/ParE family toxin [Actinocatenispora sera]BCJ32485.1 hypothetical protein Asera_65930 [Actinocatenispora sera]